MGMNVIKGWPIGEALEDSAIPFPGATIEAGMFLVKVPHPTIAGEVCVRPANTGDNNGPFLFALDSSSAFDVIDSNRIPFLRGNAIVVTDQTGAAFAHTNANIGAAVYIAAPGEDGMILSAGAAADALGWFDGLTTLQDINGDQVDAIRIILGQPALT